MLHVHEHSNRVILLLAALASCLPGCTRFNRPFDSSASNLAVTQPLGDSPSPAASLAISDGSTFDFATVPISVASSDQVFLVSNTGNAPALLDTVSTAGLGLSAPFSLTAGGTCSTGSIVAAGASCTLIVTYSPAAAITSSGTVTLGYDDGSAARTAQRAITGTGIAATGPAFVGATATITWKHTGSEVSGPGAADGQISNPSRVFIDSNLFMYVVDVRGIHKFDLVTGVYQGWIGFVDLFSPPTGDGPTGAGGCASTTNNETPGWCTGGIGLDFGFAGLGGDGTYLYASSVSSYTQKILRYNAATGAFAGWIGQVGIVPTGDAAGSPGGCAAATVNQQTPGWCVGGEAGGSAPLDDADGGFARVSWLASDATYLYAGVHEQGPRIQRYVKATGAFAGWIGRVGATSPSGDAAGYSGGACSSTTLATTPGWCMNGKAETGSVTGDGGLEGVSGLAVDAGNDALFVLNSVYASSRVERYVLSTGAYQGWVGMVDVLPTGNGPGAHPDCATTSAVGVVTPGWCLGGASAYSEADGGLRSGSGLTSDGTYLYTAQNSPSRVNRYQISTGAYQGWIGHINFAPTGGATGCVGALGVTPGWCLGGLGGYGAGDGELSYPRALYEFGGELYVAENGNSRISVFDLTKSGMAGFFDGWIGQIATPTTGWNSSPAATPAGATTFSTDGALAQASSVFADGTHVYVTEISWNDGDRLKKFDTGTGNLIGWTGVISSGLTGGDPGCVGASWGTFTPGWCLGGAGMRYLPEAGALSTPGGIWGDGTSLYVHNRNAGMISRYRASDGQFTGWIGKISTQPTGGDAGCTDAMAHPPGTFTPGWCTGGAADTGWLSGYLADGAIRDSVVVQSGLVGHGDWIYTAETYSHRVHRYHRITGAFGGWIGGVGTVSPASDGPGSPGGCASKTQGQLTPGWCIGGNSEEGNGDGFMFYPAGIATDGAYLYVGNEVRSYLNRYDLVTGEFRGWLGLTGSIPPTGGNGGCVGAAPNTPSPGWCLGGNHDGWVAIPDGIFQEGVIGLTYRAGYLYAAEGTSQFSRPRVQKFRVSTPVPQYIGWKGEIGSTTGLGGAGCAAAAVGTWTPGWCTGGDARRGTGKGAFWNAIGLAADSAYLYIVDTNAGRLVRLNR